MNSEFKNLIIGTTLIVMVLLLWPKFVTPQGKQVEETQEETQSFNNFDRPPPPKNSSQSSVIQDFATTINQQKKYRVFFEMKNIKGSFNLKGAVLDHVELKNYYTTIEKKEFVKLLSPLYSQNPHYIESGWFSEEEIELPSNNTQWSRVYGVPCDPDKQIFVFEWKNKQGYTFRKNYTIDQYYMITLEQSVKNDSGKENRISPYTKIIRSENKSSSASAMVHKGGVAYIATAPGLEDKLQEIAYDKIDATQSFYTSKGWFGFTDKYWLTALIPQNITKNIKVGYQKTNIPHTETLYEVQGQMSWSDYIKNHETISSKTAFYVGPKEISILDAYEPQYKTKHLDLSVDFGWFYILTKPLFLLLTYLGEKVNSYGLAIIILTILIKLLFFPLMQKSNRSMARMKEFSPKIEKLKKMYADDRQKQSMELMQLYKKEKINPLASCLPQIIQIPFLFGMYKVILISIEMRHQSFLGWIKDLSAPDPTTIFNLFGLIPWDPPSMLMIGFLPIVMGITMFLQQKMTPTPTVDPVQQKMFLFMPLFFVYLFSGFSVALVIYWTMSNILTILQQLLTVVAKKNQIK